MTVIPVHLTVEIHQIYNLLHNESEIDIMCSPPAVLALAVISC